MTEETDTEEVEARLRASEAGRAFLCQYEARIKKKLLSRLDTFLSGERDAVTASMDIDKLPAANLDLAVVVRHIFDKINDTRQELESLTNMARERDVHSFNGVGDELAAITHDTEKATTDIMNRIDDIEDVVRHIRSNGVQSPELDRVLQYCSEITLACSFQDITGQRVQKVVEVIESIDGQLSKIENQLGGPEITRKRTYTQSRRLQRESGLLNGPALPEEPVGQDEIDELFKTAEDAPFHDADGSAT